MSAAAAASRNAPIIGSVMKSKFSKRPNQREQWQQGNDTLRPARNKSSRWKRKEGGKQERPAGEVDDPGHRIADPETAPVAAPPDDQKRQRKEGGHCFSALAKKQKDRRSNESKRTNKVASDQHDFISCDRKSRAPVKILKMLSFESQVHVARRLARRSQGKGGARSIRLNGMRTGQRI